MHFLYLNFHDAIRSELEDVQNDARSLLAPDQQVHEKLIGLRDRVRFLEQVHSYHSSVEDEVVYPALDAKVKNVTVAYSHEHRDEVGISDMSPIAHGMMGRDMIRRAGVWGYVTHGKTDSPTTCWPLSPLRSC